MWISKKEFDTLQNASTRRDLLEEAYEALKAENAKLKERAELRDILGDFAKKVRGEFENYVTISDASMLGTVSICGVNFNEDVAQYVPDYFGGKVIKQESIKVIAIDEDGNVTYGQTGKEKKPAGRSYLLVEKSI